jgi:ribosomal protein S18 acetylase RimI-like enzyme
VSQLLGDLRGQVEANELGFFSLWCTRVETDFAVILVNTQFREDPVYNHVAQMRCTDDELEGAVDECLEIFKHYDVPACFYTSSSPASLHDVLLRKGMMEHHTMDVALLQSPQPSRDDDQSVIKKVDESMVDSWFETFARAFDAEDWLPALRRLAPQLYSADGVSLYVAQVGGELAATSALFHRDEMAGIYCVGSLANFRMRGIASHMLAQVSRIALSEGSRNVCLQYDNTNYLRSFYRRNGFRILYSRNVMMFSRSSR